jgi:hypothetical protein
MEYEPQHFHNPEAFSLISTFLMSAWQLTPYCKSYLVSFPFMHVQIITLIASYSMRLEASMVI